MFQPGRESAYRGLGHGVLDRTELQGDEVVELVPPIGGGGQPDPPTGRDLPDRMLERGGWHMVAFVDHHQAVPGGERADIAVAGQTLEGRDVDGPSCLGASAAPLAGLDPEQLVDPHAPLIGQCFAVDQNQGRDCVAGDQRAGDDGLSRSRRCDQDAQAKNSHACAPFPDRDTSRAAGAPAPRAAFR